MRIARHQLFSLPSALILASLVATAGCTGMSGEPEVTHDGLVELPDAKMDTVYEKPGADLTAYTQYAVEDCSVSFRSNWLRDQNSGRRSMDQRVTEEDMNAIRGQLATLCDEEFLAAMSREPAYPLVDPSESPAGTLVLRPSIINLDVTAPDTGMAGRSRSYTTESGEMTLFLELEDAATGDTLYRIVDRTRASTTMRMEWTNRVTNTADAKRILRAWGDKLRAGFDRVIAQP